MTLVQPRALLTAAGRRISRPDALQWVLLALVLVAALGIRLEQIDDPPTEYHPTRNYHAALIARGIYYEWFVSAPAWKERIAVANRRREGVIEPPMMEAIAAVAYGVAGGEHLWIARLFSCLFWFCGGVFLFLIARRLASSRAAVFSVAFYLLLPFAVTASRSFQPDPLMIALFLAAVFALLRYYDQPSPRRVVLAGLVAGAAVSIKPGISLLPIIGALLALVISRDGVAAALRSSHVYLFGLLAALPAGAYYLYGTAIRDFLRGQTEAKIVPELLVQGSFWSGWLDMVLRVLGTLPLVGASVGVFVLARRPARALIVGLAAGYVAYGLVFTYHIHTHEYYSLFLVPIAAIPIGALADAVYSRVTRLRRAAWLVAVPVFVAFVGAVLVHAREARSRADPKLANVGLSREIGRLVHHSPHTILLARAYGGPLKYYGWLGGRFWPGGGDLNAERILGRPKISIEERLAKSDPARAYFVITDLREYRRQPALGRYLRSNFPRLARTRDYLIFDLRKR